MLTPDAVASFFQGIARLYVPDSVEVELLERATSCPVRGMVGWDVDRWRILADETLTPRSLLTLLFHELAHVHYGEVEKQQNAWSWDRAVFTGQQTVAAALRRQGWVVQGKGEQVTKSEDRANGWAVRQVDQWLPVLDCIENVGTQVKQQLKGVYIP